MLRRVPRWALSLLCLTGILSLVWAATFDDKLRQHLTYLADDAREGRGIGTKGLDQAADYIAAQFAEMGLAPAFEGGYFQPFDMGWGVTLGPNNRLTARTASFDTSSGIMPLGFSSAATVTGPVAFIGYGITAPEYNYDDFAGLDLTGKIALCFTGEPGEFDTASVFEGVNYTTHATSRAKLSNAKMKGAVAILFVEGPVYADKEAEKFEAPRADEPYLDGGIPAVRITRDAAARLYPTFDLYALQHLIDEKAQPRSMDIDTARVTLTTDLTRKSVTVKNVGGIIPGDSTVIVIGAHYDHLGYGQQGSLEPEPGRIHNGADDNASGVSAILETARLLKEKPLRATVMVVAFTAEEVGLGGSNHLVKNFPGGFERVRTMINLDMVGHVKDNKLTIVGCKTAEQFESLVAEARTGIDLDVNCKGDGYGPSDNMSFYVAGKPVLYLFSGAHEDYHKGSDDVDKINFDGLAKVTRLTESLARTVDGFSDALVYIKTTDAPQQGGGRLRSSLGTVPDFSQPDSLKGYLVGDAKPNSAAANAGLTRGDLVVRVGKVSISNIYDLMSALRIYAPGDTVDVTYQRGADEKTVQAVLQQSSR